ncbi:unnamed protein product [Schistosoma margrebowiei]|uniref:Heat shock protein family B (small) member 11 n=1 Tax=Schistosoma margrebowiei TaxID=48269 RepID=A0AA85AB14_9TREM|nr:unnamed protein product [Schistosoma margrebowiei]
MDCVSRSGGCFISFATSWGKSHPPEDVLDKRKGSFWITTGLFPQMLVISLDQPRKVSQIKIVTSRVKALCFNLLNLPLTNISFPTGVTHTAYICRYK